MEITRRKLLGAGSVAALTALAGCTSSGQTVRYQGDPVDPADRVSVNTSEVAFMYGEKLDEPYPLPPIPYKKIKPIFYRQMVANPTGQPPGTLVVDTGNHFLYLTLPNGQAMRYGVGLGRAGFAWEGRGLIQYKRKWPKWTPPVEMVARQPELQEKLGLEGSMEPGLENPLGARALYIFQNGEDTLYRIHGSPEWWSIGKSVSSGCVRMMNQDICDLYDRVPNKTTVVVTNLSNAGLQEVVDQPVREEYIDRPIRQEFVDDNDVLLEPVY